MDPGLWDELEGDHADEVAALIRLRSGAEPPAAVRVLTRFGDVATCRLRRGDILAVRSSEAVVSMKAPQSLVPEPLLAVSPGVARSRRAPRPGRGATGRGVVVGIVDWGCDFAHPSFVDEAGRTRLLALWDQRPGPSHRSPRPYGYGAAYGPRAIARALASATPYDALGYDPADVDFDGSGSHGTHVAGVAAGGWCGDRPGLAPDADLVFVHMARHKSGPRGLGSSVSLLEAVDFVARAADGRPWVVNMSLGAHGGPHDGTTLVERGLDNAVGGGPGRCIVQSAGNYYRQSIHTQGRLAPGERHRVPWLIDERDETPNRFEIWYPGSDALVISLVAPDGARIARAGPDEQRVIHIDGERVGRLAHRRRDPNNHDNQAVIALGAGVAGRWQVELEGVGVRRGDYHVWIERDEMTPGSQSRLPRSVAVGASTTGSICNGANTIAVGAYDPGDPKRRPASFSSAGPTRDGRIKPDLLAPGVGIVAARSAPLYDDGFSYDLTVKSGTSMAAPHVTGTVALMYEAAGRPLHAREIRRVLFETASPAIGAAERVGHGRLDTAAAVRAARRVGRRSAAHELNGTARALSWAGPARVFDGLLAASVGSAPSGVVASARPVALPGRRPVLQISAGDLVVRRALGEGDAAAVARVEALDDGVARVERIAPGGERRDQWVVLEGGRLRDDVLVLRDAAAATTAAESICEKKQPAADEPTAPPPRTSLLAAAATVTADDPKPDPGVRMDLAGPQNLVYWKGLRLWEIGPLRGIDPRVHPNAYANRTIALQRFARKQALDRRVLGRTLAADGVLGPRTLLIVWRVASDDDLSLFRTDLQALGFDLDRAAKGRSIGLDAEAFALPPTYLAEWSLSGTSDQMLDLYHWRHKDTPAIRAAIATLLFKGVAGEAPEFDWTWAIELLRLVYGGHDVRGRAALVRMKRPRTHRYDASRLVKRHLGKTTDTQWIWWDPTPREYAGAAKRIPLPLPRGAEAQRAVKAWKSGEGPPFTRLVFALYLPKVTDAERIRVVEQWLGDRAVKEHQRKQHNREALRGEVDEVIGELKTKRRSFVWASKFSKRIDVIALYDAEILDTFFDLLKQRDGGRWFDELFDAFGGMVNNGHRSTLVRAASKSKYASSDAYKKFLARHRKKVEEIRSHAYDFENNRILLDKKSSRAVDLSDGKGRVVGDVSRVYHRDESIERLKESARKKLCVQTVKELADKLASLDASADDGDDGDAGVSEEMINEAIERAAKAIGLSKDDVEELDWELSMRVYAIRPVVRDGVRRAEIDCELVERVVVETKWVGNIAARLPVQVWSKWESVPNSRRWRTEEEFGEELFFFMLSELEDVLSFLGLVVIGASVGFLLWTGGAGAALVKLAGGGKMLVASIVLSEVIYLITARGDATLEGVMMAAVEGYVQAVGFRLFAPVGTWIGAKLTGEGLKRSLAAWLLQKSVVGAGSGALANTATLFAHDLSRVLREGGDFSAWDRYLKAAGTGAAFGALFEIGGSVVFAGLFRQLPGTVLDKAEAIVDLLVKNKVSPSKWLAGSTGALSKFGSWLGEVTQSARAGGMAAMRQRVVAVTEAFLRRTGRNVKLMFYQDIIDLAEVRLSSHAIDGLERFLDVSAGKLAADDVVAVAQALRRAPKRADGILSLVGAVDKKVLGRLANRDDMLKLISSDGIGGLVERASFPDVRYLLQRGFGGELDGLDKWAERWALLNGERQSQVLDAVRHHGEVLSPTAALKLAELSIQLDANLMVGVDRLARLRSAEAVDALVGAAGARDADALGAMLAGPDAADRLLSHTDDAAQALGLMRAAGNDVDFLAEVLPVARPKTSRGLGKLDDTELAGLERLARAGSRSSRRASLAQDIEAIAKSPSEARALLRAAAAADDATVARLMHEGRLAELVGTKTPKVSGAAAVRSRAHLLRKGAATHEVYTSGPVPAGSGQPRYLDDPGHWVPERRNVHNEEQSAAVGDSRALADHLPPPPTLYATRGNSAVGKSRLIESEIPELHAANKATKDHPRKAINPDPFKKRLIETADAPVTNDQVHPEASMLSRRHEQALVDLKRSDGSVASIVVDKRLLPAESVRKYAKMAHDSGRKFRLYDIDAPLEASLVGVLRRSPGKGEAILKFEAIAEGFVEARRHRASVIEQFKGDKTSTYTLYGTTAEGKQVLVASVDAGSIDMKLPKMFDELIGDASAHVRRLESERITDEVIERITKPIENRAFAKEVEELLRKPDNFGKTWKEALDAHAKKTGKE